MNKVILAVLGHDRPGIVAAVTHILFECDCNIENVSQTILKTEFSGSFIISMPPDLTQGELRHHCPLWRQYHQSSAAFRPWFKKALHAAIAP